MQDFKYNIQDVTQALIDSMLQRTGQLEMEVATLKAVNIALQAELMEVQKSTEK